MSQSPPASPLRFDPSFEVFEKDEAVSIEGIKEQMQKISDTTYKHSAHGLRSVHAKSHGLLVGELEVLGNLPEPLAQGIFSASATYPVVMRLSTSAGDLLDDNVSLPRGLGMKLIGVPGTRLPGSEDATTQDFLMINGPTFLKPGPKSFLSSLKLLAATTDHADGLKKVFSAALREIEKVVEAAGGQSPTLISLGGHPETHILGETFYTQVPILLGPYMAKFCLTPVSPALIALTHAPVDLKDKPDGLREAVSGYFATQGGEWELRAQLCTDLATMPVEDASVAWPEDRSPYLAVARLTVKAQPTWNDARARAIDDGLAFNPWHGIAEHRPLGSIMRTRRVVYAAMSLLRRERNGRAHAEPRSLDELKL
jgi:hypothetical protein